MRGKSSVVKQSFLQNQDCDRRHTFAYSRVSIAQSTYRLSKPLDHLHENTLRYMERFIDPPFSDPSRQNSLLQAFPICIIKPILFRRPIDTEIVTQPRLQALSKPTLPIPRLQFLPHIHRQLLFAHCGTYFLYRTEARVPEFVLYQNL